ncbi:MAG: site-2 protease family protein [Ruminococcaceae bacterium]|nr:site-2 protease family protein [Oscillospiraceae bacterium]
MGLNVWEILETIPAVLLALTFHEAAHGYAAYLLGDTTAREQGRLTINPLRHIDILGLLSMILFRFGWAKPVPVNPRRFRKPKLGMALVALAGPLANIIWAFLCVLVFYLCRIWFPDSAAAYALSDFFALTGVLSVGFAVFNLLPLPPLDGFRMVSLVLPNRWVYWLMRYERYISLAVLALLMLDVLTVPLALGRGVIIQGIESIVRWIVL